MTHQLLGVPRQVAIDGDVAEFGPGADYRLDELELAHFAAVAHGDFAHQCGPVLALGKGAGFL